MEISLLALRYFQKTAQLQHLSRAASELHIVQPALSRMIHSLEEEMGVPFFDRKNRSIVLNDYGKIFLKYTDQILLAMESARQELEDKQHKDIATVTLSLYAASKIIPALLTDFQKENPNIRLQILQQGISGDGAVEADLSLFSSITPMDNDHSVTLLEEELFLALPTSDPRASLQEAKLTDFADSGFISLQQGKTLRTITDFYCRMAGFTPNICLECDSPGTVREFIRAGFGISFVPGVTWCGVADEKVALVPISAPSCRRYIGLSWKEQAYLSDATLTLRDYLIKNFAAYAIRNSEKYRQARTTQEETSR